MIVFANVVALEMTLWEQHENRIPHLSNEQVESNYTFSGENLQNNAVSARNISAELSLIMAL